MAMTEREKWARKQFDFSIFEELCDLWERSKNRQIWTWSVRDIADLGHNMGFTNEEIAFFIGRFVMEASGVRVPLDEEDEKETTNEGWV